MHLLSSKNYLRHYEQFFIIFIIFIVYLVGIYFLCLILDSYNISTCSYSISNGANFSNANLNDAVLSGAQLNDVNLRNANLNDASLFAVKNLTPKQIKSACYWEKAFYKDKYDTEQSKGITFRQANQKYIEKLKADRASDPEKPVDCSQWKVE